MTDELKPKIDSSKSEKVKSQEKRQAQIEQGRQKVAGRDGMMPTNANPIVLDETYGGLRQENRVVMRHNIALNIESFRAAPDDFTPRPTKEYGPLQPVSAPFFSVIIPNYNGRALLPTVLDALRRQSLRDFEVIVIDDASRDDSVALIEQNYPEVRLIVNRSNLGFVKNCNTAADAAHGRILIFLNSDTEPEDNWLAEMAQVIVTNPQAAIVASKLLLFDKRTTLHTAGDLLGRDGIPHNRGVWQEDRGQFDADTQIFSGCGGAVAYRRDVWQALGGFDDDFWMYLEDVDYGFRAQLAGYEAVFAPKARVYHKLSASGGDVLASYYVGRNTIWMIVKNMPRSLLLRNLPQIVAAQVKIAIDALRNWRGEAAQARLRGQLDGVLGLIAPLRKRQAIQRRRLAEDHEIAMRLA